MKKISEFILSLTVFLFVECIMEDPMHKPYTGFTPVDIGDGWAISSPSAENVDSAKLDNIYRKVYDADDTWMMKSLLVFRNGKLIGECYLKSESDRFVREAIWSCTKQVTGIITGIAISQGYITDAGDSIGKYLPDYISRHPDKKSLTLEHLLTMNSGLAFDNGTQNDLFRQRKLDDGIEYILGLGFSSPVGTSFYYKDCDPHLVSAIIQRAAGKPLDLYAKEVFFDRLGITNYEWKRYTDGVTTGAWGILTTPRELAKIAQCVLDSGKCNGQQVIPLNWWHNMLDVHVANAHEDAAFGYLWWSIPSKGWYFMWGHGGQYAFAMPSKRLLIVATSLPQVEDDFALWYDQILSIADEVASVASKN